MFGVRSEFVRSSFRVRSEFGVCSEFVRSSFGVRSELVRSSFGVCLFGACSELFHREPGPLRNAYYVACGKTLKNAPVQDLSQIAHAFFGAPGGARRGQALLIQAPPSNVKW